MQRSFLYLIFLVLPFQISAQVAELGRKFHLPDSLLPTETQWKDFLKQNMHSEDRLSVSNPDSSKVYAVIVQRDNASARKFADEVFMARGMHDLKQQISFADTLEFFGFPWFSLKEGERIFRACPPFSTGLFKAPDLKTAIKYFAFHDLATRKYFARHSALWSLHEFTGKTTGADLALEGKPPIVTSSYLRDWYNSQKKAVETVTQMIPQLKSIAPKTHVSVDARAGVHVINNEDFSKSLIPFAYLNSEGVAFIGFICVIETDKKRSIYLWNNKTPLEHVGRVQDQLVQLFASFPSSQWNPTDPPERRKYIFNHNFWNNEVEVKLDNGNFKYLTLIGGSFKK